MTHASMPPLVSFCIPTYKRSRYLRSLLDSLVGQLAAFPYPYEIVIADNASPDDTAQVVASFADRLPIRSLRHETNIGGYPNWQFVMSKAIGRYLVYLSDDDSLLGDQVAATIAKMEADPEIAVVYAPWLLFDLVAQQAQGQFYEVPHDLRIERGQHSQLLDHILRHHIFPEIQITRRDAFEATMPRINEHAFLAFMHAADYLTEGAVLIQQQPFYVAITRYFEDDEREQLGADEVEQAWDRYRGGLEYLLARSATPISAEERIGFQLRIQEMVASRMGVAIRLRHQKKRNPIDSYYLAMRLRGMGFEAKLPVPMATLASEALLAFLLRDPELTRGVRQIVCVGSAGPDEREYLAHEAAVPVEFVSDLSDCDAMSDALLFVRGDAVAAQQLDSARAAQRNVRVLHERHLASKFGL
jgi:poly(ribitol-phosphate) beta-N-acetylglucosaminyltransferase